MKQDSKKSVRKRGSLVLLVALVAALTVVVGGSGASGQDPPLPPTPALVAAGTLVFEDGFFTHFDTDGTTILGDPQPVSSGCRGNQDDTDDALVILAATEGGPSQVSFVDNGLAVRGSGDGNGRRSACAY
ncbi:MAG: hypothetical protein ACR2PK_13665, partial [Acidimicrobiales bacterium]